MSPGVEVVGVVHDTGHPHLLNKEGEVGENHEGEVGVGVLALAEGHVDQYERQDYLAGQKARDNNKQSEGLTYASDY